MALFTPDTRFLVYMDRGSGQPTQELPGRESLAPVLDNLSTYQATMHFNGQSTVVLEGDGATGESYCIAHHLYVADGQCTLMTALVRDGDQADIVAARGADAFRRVLEHDAARGYYVIGNGAKPTVAELTEAAAVAGGAPGAAPGSDEEARARLGDYFAEVLLLDQGTDPARARTELGWEPSHPTLADEFRHGSYRK
jgi:nucleoside-diphosphate-sugar epimerase